METTTLFLAQLWGPIMTAAGLGFFVSKQFYMKVYRDLEKAPFAVIFFGMVAMAAGIVHVQVHNSWESLPEIIVTLFGWSLLLKGVVCTTFPSLADRSGDWALSAKLVPGIGVAALLLGGYLLWLGYFA